MPPGAATVLLVLGSGVLAATGALPLHKPRHLATHHSHSKQALAFSPPCTEYHTKYYITQRASHSPRPPHTDNHTELLYSQILRNAMRDNFQRGRDNLES